MILRNAWCNNYDLPFMLKALIQQRMVKTKNTQVNYCIYKQGSLLITLNATDLNYIVWQYEYVSEPLVLILRPLKYIKPKLQQTTNHERSH